MEYPQLKMPKDGKQAWLYTCTHCGYHVCVELKMPALTRKCPACRKGKMVMMEAVR